MLVWECSDHQPALPHYLIAPPRSCFSRQALKSKLSGAESAADAAAGAWALGHLGVKEAGMGKALGEAIKVR